MKITWAMPAAWVAFVAGCGSATSGGDIDGGADAEAGLDSPVDGLEAGDGNADDAGPASDDADAGRDVDAVPPDGTDGDGDGDADVAPETEAADAEPEAEAADAGPEADVPDAEPEAEAADAGPEADVADAGPEADVADAEPEADVADVGPEAEAADAGPEADVADVEPGEGDEAGEGGGDVALLPDYAPIGLTVPDEITLGFDFRAVVEVENRGTADGAADPLWATLILSSDDAPDTPADDLFLMGAALIRVDGPLARGASGTGEQVFEMMPLPGNEPGVYFAYVRVGAGGEMELRTDNNVLRRAGTVAVVAFAGRPVVIETFPTLDADRFRTSLTVYEAGDTMPVRYWFGSSAEKPDGYARWSGELWPGTFHVQVGSYMVSPCGAYAILYDTTGTAAYTARATGLGCAVADGYEPDDVAADATPLAEGVAQEHSITEAPVNYYDWFEVVVP
jgi:hypothetical protein